MTTRVYIYTNELTHHGIKGQKWGIRRFQNKDGSLTPAGRKRYDDDGPSTPKKSKQEGQTDPKRRDKLVAKYQSEGVSLENAKLMADRRIKAEKFAIAAGTTAAIAATAYYVNKYRKNNVDKMIKSATEMQRISANSNINKALYLSFDKKDNIKYRGMYGMEKGGEGLKQLSLKAKGNIKIASRKHAEDAFVDLYKNNPEFREATFRNMKKMASEGWGTSELQAYAKNFVRNDGKVSDKEMRKHVYEVFNMGLVNTRGDAKTSGTLFYNKLRSLGYDAITDLNDQKYSGYNTKAPTILFNPSKVALEKVSELSKQQINSDYLKSKRILAGQKAVKAFLAVTGGATLTAGSAATAVYGANTAAILKYRSEHPNTKLSDKEIIKMLQS